MPAAALRHAVFGAVRLDLAGTIPATRSVHARSAFRHAVFGAARLDLAGTIPRPVDDRDHVMVFELKGAPKAGARF